MKRLVSSLLQSGAAIKNYCFDQGLIRPHRVDAFVISVGNIAAGGRGKTAVVQWLVKELKDVAVLTRGYRSQMEHRRSQLIDAKCDPVICGDEPALLARMAERPLVYVGKNRCDSAQMARAAGAKVLILDDGMQYRYLNRDVEIVCVHEDDFTGKSFLRERLNALKRADLVVVMDKCDRKEQDVLLKNIKCFTEAPICGVRYRLSPMHGKKVAAFCALGNPQKFFEDLKRAGAEVVAQLKKADHRPFTEKELKKFASGAKEADVLMCTAKDWVKLKHVNLPIECAHAELEWIFGQEHLEKVIYEVMD